MTAFSDFLLTATCGGGSVNSDQPDGTPVFRTARNADRIRRATRGVILQWSDCMSKPHVLVGILAALLILGKFAATGEHEEVPLARHQSHDSLAVQGKSKISWKQAVGQQVIAQGVAWGKWEKGIGDRVILDGTTIYVAKPVALD